VHWAALYFAWCEEKVEDKVLVEVQNESIFWTAIQLSELINVGAAIWSGSILIELLHKY
jgi:hypothetical protein